MTMTLVKPDVENHTNLLDLSREEWISVSGGRMKLPGAVNHGPLLTTADGEPVSVYVDGVLINSPVTGFAPG